MTDGYLQVTHRRRSGKGGPGAGRPAKHYEATGKEVQVQFPARRYDLLAELLVRVVQRLAPDAAAEIAEEIGRETVDYVANINKYYLAYKLQYESYRRRQAAKQDS